MMDFEFLECLCVLSDLADCMAVDRVVLASPCRSNRSLQVLTISAGDPENPDVLTLPFRSDLSSQVMIRNEVLRLSEVRDVQGFQSCSLMTAEELTAFMGAPVQDSYGEPVACLSVATHLPRIWSAQEAETLILAAATLRSMLFDTNNTTWHDALHFGDTQ